MGVVIIEGERAVFRVNLGRSIVTNGAFATHSSQITLSTRLKVNTANASLIMHVTM